MSESKQPDAAKKALEQRVAGLEWQLAGKQEELKKTQEALQSTTDVLHQVYNTKSWKLTRPLRGFSRVRSFMKDWYARRPKWKFTLPVLPHRSVLHAGARRTAVIACHSVFGEADALLLHTLTAWQETGCEIVIVLAGDLTAACRETLAHFGTLITLPFESSRAACYMAGLDKLRRSHRLPAEILLTDADTLVPIADLDNMLNTMAERDLDVWGLTVTRERFVRTPSYMHFEPWHECPRSELLAVRGPLRRRILSRRFLKKHTDCTHDMLISLYEAWKRAGYRYDSYLPLSLYDGLSDDPLRNMPVEMLNHCPFVSPQALCDSYEQLVYRTGTEEVPMLIRKLSAEAPRMMDMLAQRLLKTCHADELARNLQLKTILFDRDTGKEDAQADKPAAVFVLDDLTHAPLLASYAANLPENCRLTVAVRHSQTADQYVREAFSGCRCQLNVVHSTSTHDPLTLLKTLWTDSLADAGILFFLSDIRPADGKWSEEHFTMQANCAAGTATYVRHVLDLFHRHPRLGLLVSPRSADSGYINECSTVMPQLVDRIIHAGLCLPVAQDHPFPVMTECAFWVRPAALEKILPQLRSAATTQERIVQSCLPVAAVQDAGLFTVTVMDEATAAHENLRLIHDMDLFTSRLTDLMVVGRFGNFYRSVESALAYLKGGSL